MTEAAKGKSTIKPEYVFDGAQILRIACSCAEHAPLVTTSNVGVKHPTVPAKLKEPGWVAGLYVLWAVKPPDGTEPDFHLGLTDDKGYCQAVREADTGKDTLKVPKLTESSLLLVWFLRATNIEAADWATKLEARYKDRLRSGAAGGANLDADPIDVRGASEPNAENPTLTFHETTSGGKKVREPVLRVPAKPELFHPKGPDAYGRFRIYRAPSWEPKGIRAMPHAACDAVQKAVRRLQAQLGAMRYPVGDHGYPYVPSYVNSNFPNAGLFDVLTWSSLLAFQRDATSAKAGTVASDVMQRAVGLETLTADDAFKQQEMAVNTPDAQPLVLRKEALSHLFADDYVETSPPNVEGTLALGMVCAVTAKTIDAWIQGDGGRSFRKPGPVLVVAARVEGMGAIWLRQEAATQLERWSRAVADRGFSHGVLINHGFRDPRQDALGAAFGRAKCSIHKTGFAADLRMSGFQPAEKLWNIGLHLEASSLHEGATVSRVGFRLFGPVNVPAKKQIVDAAASSATPEPAPATPETPGQAKERLARFAAPTVEGKLATERVYWRNFDQFTYEPTHPYGGRLVADRPGPFVDITKVGALLGWRPIHSFGYGDMTGDDWRSRPRLYVLSGKDDAKPLGSLFSELVQLHKVGKLCEFGHDPGGPSTDAKLEYAVGIPGAFLDAKNKPDADSLKKEVTAEEQKPDHVHQATVKDYPRPALDASLAWLGVKGFDPSSFARRLDYFEKALKEKDAFKVHLESQARKFFGELLAKRKVEKQLHPSFLAGRKVLCYVCPKGTSFEDALKIPPKEIELPADAADLIVGDGANALPGQSFWVISKDLDGFRKKHVSGSWIYLPRTVGEPIGMEWWHFQLESGGLQRDDPTRLAAAERALGEAKANRTTAGKKPPKEVAEALDKKIRAASAERDAAVRMGWAELVYQIGWTYDALAAIGYHDDDFTRHAN